MDIAKLSLEAGHIAPTAPDTLGKRKELTSFDNDWLGSWYVL
jgi:hypothetical protein